MRLRGDFKGIDEMDRGERKTGRQSAVGGGGRRTAV